MCQAAAHNYAGILATRFFLGLFEAGFYPGVLFHFSFWYSPDQMPLRLAFFYACGVFSTTISGLLGMRWESPRSEEVEFPLMPNLFIAYAISFMNNAGHLAGWRWVFIL